MDMYNSTASACRNELKGFTGTFASSLEVCSTIQQACYISICFINSRVFFTLDFTLFKACDYSKNKKGKTCRTIQRHTIFILLHKDLSLEEKRNGLKPVTKIYCTRHLSAEIVGVGV